MGGARAWERGSAISFKTPASMKLGRGDKLGKETKPKEKEKIECPGPDHELAEMFE